MLIFLTNRSICLLLPGSLSALAKGVALFLNPLTGWSRCSLHGQNANARANNTKRTSVRKKSSKDTIARAKQHKVDKHANRFPAILAKFAKD
jgi:UPF0716 family protein affecting phage T7 exclusion